MLSQIPFESKANMGIRSFARTPQVSNYLFRGSCGEIVEMKIATWNVNSISLRLTQMIQWLNGTGRMWCACRRRKSSMPIFPIQAIKEAGFHVAFFGQKSYNGVAIISKSPIEDVQKGFRLTMTTISPKRLIAATINGIRIINTYIPNGTELWTDKFTFKLDWLQRLRRMFDETCDVNKNVLLCGDFNVAPDDLDVWNPCRRGPANSIFQSRNGPQSPM